VSIHPLVVETVFADGARYRVSWFDPPFRPPLGDPVEVGATVQQVLGRPALPAVTGLPEGLGDLLGRGWWVCAKASSLAPTQSRVIPEP
jgi:hypothetical protein